jgi:hypothetical protein
MPKTLEAAINQMYWALRASPCGCCGKWKMVKGIKGMWVVTKECSRCVALAAYEKLVPQNDKTLQSEGLDVPSGSA